MNGIRPTLALVLSLLLVSPLAAEPLPGTRPLATEGDLAAQMVAGIDRYLMRELAASVEKRRQYWKPDFSSPEAYTKSVQPNRDRLRQILGVVDPRVPVEMRLVATTEQSSLVAETDSYRVHAVRWPVFESVEGEGLLLEPKGKVAANVVVLPDADLEPEALAALVGGAGARGHTAHLLAEQGCRVVVPVLVNRLDTFSGNPDLGRMTNQPHREFVYRMAFYMGRHIIGYEVQKILAVVDWFTRQKDELPVGVHGRGEGGLVALYSAAIDPRIKTVAVEGYFGKREEVWKEPIYRNVWGLLREFGDAEIASLIAPRSLVVEFFGAPEVAGPPAARPGRAGAAPGSLRLTAEETVRSEVQRAASLSYERFRLSGGAGIFFEKTAPAERDDSLQRFLTGLVGRYPNSPKGSTPTDKRVSFDPAARQKRQFDQLVAFTQKLKRDSEQRRQETFWSKIDTSSVEKFQASTAPFRKQLWEEVIGKLPAPTQPMNPRTRLAYEAPKWKGYEVVLDLYPDVFAYGVLCLPNDLKPGEKRPVVVCQHGLEGRPADVVNPKERTKYYNSFGAQLAERGYIVYVPQNPYIGKDDFRVLQRKANPLGLSLFSFIIAQHERTLDWLAALPFVDPERMAFYGLSYGGKTAMRVPAVLPRYCLSICSGDFNEWTWKNVSIDFRGSYMFTGEYEMPEFNMGHTLVYAEMAALIAPRPFMVERGHDDGVGIDEWVAYEYAKVRRLYSRLKLPERTAIEFFAGGHVINGKGTFEFLDRHLKWQPR